VQVHKWLAVFLSGDVDSCDDNEFEDDDNDDEEDEHKMPVSQRMRNRRTNNLNKNRLHSNNSPYNNMNPNIMAQQQQYQQHQNPYNMRAGSSSHQSVASNIKVNNLDLLNGLSGCPDNGHCDNQNGASSRRLRMYGQNAFNRHETKL